MDTLKVAQVLLDAGDGITVDREGNPYQGTGYVVAKPKYGKILTDQWITYSQVASWVRYLPISVDYVGAWRDGDHLYLDVVDIVEDRETAVTMGRIRNQIAIWDAGNQLEIPTGGTGETE